MDADDGINDVSLKNIILGKISKQDFINKYNIRIFFNKLPKKVNGYVFIYKGIYNVHINKMLNDEEKDSTILHEFAHIERNELGYNNLTYGFRCSIVGDYDKADEYIDKLLENIR